MPHSPTTRSHIERLTLLRDLLRRGGGNAEALGEQLEVCERTVRRDLHFARVGLKWPVEYDAGKRSWVLNGNPPALPALPMSQGELMAMAVAARALDAYKGTPYHAELHAGFAKLVAALEAPLGISLASGGALPVFDLDPVREVDPQLFARLYTACQNRRRLELTYLTQARNEVNVRRVDPYALHNHAGDWYLIGHCHLRGGVRDFALGERMIEVLETGERFEVDSGFNLQEHVRSGFGIFKGGTTEEVVLRFSPAQARYMKERVWAENEVKEEQPDGSLLLRMRLPVNDGVVRFVLQYGADVEVLEPETLRQRVAEALEKARGLYR